MAFIRQLYNLLQLNTHICKKNRFDFTKCFSLLSILDGMLLHQNITPLMAALFKSYSSICKINIWNHCILIPKSANIGIKLSTSGSVGGSTVQTVQFIEQQLAVHLIEHENSFAACVVTLVVEQMESYWSNRWKRKYSWWIEY